MDDNPHLLGGGMWGTGTGGAHSSSLLLSMGTQWISGRVEKACGPLMGTQTGLRPPNG